MTRQQFCYVIIEEDDTSALKIGHAFNPVERIASLQTGNPRKINILLTLAGGEILENEIHKKFANFRIIRGGEEWFRNIPELIEFLQEKVKQILSGNSFISQAQVSFGPITIPKVELVEANMPELKQTARTGSIQPHLVTEAQPAKDSRFNVGRKKKQ